MRSSPIALLVAASLLGACDSGPTHPAVSQTEPSFSLLGNAWHLVSFEGTTCNGDIIKGSVFVHVNNSSTQAASGTSYVTNHLNLNGSGVAEPSGATYHVAEVLELTVSFNSLPFYLTRVQHFILVGQGGAENQVGQILLHLTVDANGVVAAFVDSVHVICSS